ncbi:IPT/TIG domain-containing protein [Jatrophihabitans sp. YIM 134969]
MTEQSSRRWWAVPTAVLATLVTTAGLATASTAAADPLGSSGGAKGAPASAAPNPDAGCTLSPSLTQKSDDLSCIGVGATLSSVPALGATATLTVTVRAGRAEAGTRVTVDLPSTLAFADGTATTAAVNGAGAAQRATLATTDLAPGASRTYTRTVKAVRTGFGELTAKASAVVGKTRTDVGADTVHLTVGATAATTHKGLAPKTGDGAVVATRAKVAPLAVNRPSAPLPALSRPATQSAATAAAPGTTCATGTWAFTDAGGATVGTAKAVIQVWRGGAQIASQFANNSGGYTLCWASGGTANSVYVRFVHTNKVWKVVNDAGADYAYVTGTVSIADGGTYDFGTLLPADTTQRRALHAYHTAAITYDWIYQNSGTDPNVGCWSPYGSSCRQMQVMWQADHASGSNWTPDRVYLGATSPDSEDVPTHEYNHELMYDLYGSTFPSTTNCSPHYLFSVSSTTCAWTEGYADWADVSVWGNTLYTYSTGGTDDFNRTWDGGDAGDQVEGRVVQALASLNDGAKYPFDNISGPGYRTAVNFWSTMRTYKPTTFASFWAGRAAGGQDVSQAALSALFQGTIDYGFRNPLTDGISKNQPQAYVAHNYSATTTRNYWSAVAVRPQDGSDSDLILYDDAAQSSVLASSGYTSTTTDFVAVNSNSGVRPLQTYFPRVNRFAGTGNYTVGFYQGSSTLSSGGQTVSTGSTLPISIRDSYQNAGVPVYYRAVPLAGQTLALSFLQPGVGVLGRSSAVNGPVGAAGQDVSLAVTPSATGYAGLVLVNQGMTSGGVQLWADVSAPTGTISIAGGAASTTKVKPTVTLSGSDAETGVVSMQLSTDGTFDTEAVVPYATSTKVQLPGANGAKTVWVRYLNNAGMWSAPVSDSISLLVPPTITSISPKKGPTAGGTTVTIQGTRFTGATAVKFGTVAATSFTVVSDTKIQAVSPAGTGAVQTKVTVPAGSVTGGTFTYVRAPAVTAVSPRSGAAGTVVTITGTDLTGATSVKFGSKVTTSFTVVSATKITVPAPNGVSGTVNVRVTTPGGQSAVVTAATFTYTA